MSGTIFLASDEREQENEKDKEENKKVQNSARGGFIPANSANPANKEKIPVWLIPDTSEWEKAVERNGIADMQERRAAWFAQREKNKLEVHA